MKKITAMVITLALILSMAVSFSIGANADAPEGWTVLEQIGEGATSGTVNFGDDGSFLLSTVAYTGIGIASGKLYNLSDGLEIVCDITKGTVCGTGEGVECYRYFSVVLSADKPESVIKNGASTRCGCANFVELRFFDDNALTGKEYTVITGGNASGVIAYENAYPANTVLPLINTEETADETVKVTIDDENVCFYLNGELIATVYGANNGLLDYAYLSFNASAYGAATITDTAVKTINGTPAASSQGTEATAPEQTMIGEGWQSATVNTTAEGNVGITKSGKIMLSSGEWGGAMLYSTTELKTRNRVELEFDFDLGVGNIPTGGPAYLRRTEIVLMTEPVESDAVKVASASLAPNCEGTVGIRICDSEELDGSKLLYITATGSLLNEAMGNVVGIVNDYIPITNINVKEDSHVKVKLVIDNKYDITVFVNGEETATVEGILRGFYGEAYLGIVSASYGSATNVAMLNAINGIPANDFDVFNYNRDNISNNKSGCGNKA